MQYSKHEHDRSEARVQVEKFPDGLQCLAKVCFDGAVRDAEAKSDLFVGEPVLTAEVVNKLTLCRIRS